MLRPPPLKYTQAKRLRKAMTPPEVWLWARLKGQREGFHFRKQHPIGPYIVDFYCASARLVIEVDGMVHNILSVAERDEKRMKFLESQGLEIMRIPTADILHDPDEIALGIVIRVQETLKISD